MKEKLAADIEGNPVHIYIPGEPMGRRPKQNGIPDLAGRDDRNGRKKESFFEDHEEEDALD